MSHLLKGSKKLGLVLTAGLISTVCSASGADGSGGGSQIEAAFRLKGEALIVQVADNVQANSACASTLMQNSFDSAKISVVNQLTDPDTHKPIGENLDAWTEPGDMQLLQSSWAFLVNPNLPTRMKEDKSVNLLVLHEIYRTTGSCNDDNFQISDKVFGYLQGKGTSKFSEEFVFKYVYSVIDGGDDDAGDFWYLLTNPAALANGNGASLSLCDQPIENTGKATCISDNPNSNPGTVYFYIGDESIVAKSGGPNFPQDSDADFMAASDDAATSETFSVPSKQPEGDDEIADQWQHVSPQHPFIVVHDIENGTWSSGIE